MSNQPIKTYYIQYLFPYCAYNVFSTYEPINIENYQDTLYHHNDFELDLVFDTYEEVLLYLQEQRRTFEIGNVYGDNITICCNGLYATYNNNSKSFHNFNEAKQFIDDEQQKYIELLKWKNTIKPDNSTITSRKIISPQYFEILIINRLSIIYLSIYKKNEKHININVFLYNQQ